MERDHSVEGYLERRTTGELMDILQAYQDTDISAWEAGVADLIIEILKKRGYKLDPIAVSALRKRKVSVPSSRD